jgi:hypothetical protein
MTVSDLWSLMLDYIELGSAQATDRMRVHGATAIMSAAQRIRRKRPELCHTIATGVAGGDGWSGTLELAANAQTIISASGFTLADVPVGSSAFVTGDLSGRNGFEKAGTTYSLLHPYGGTATMPGPVTVRIVRDCIPLPAGTASILNNRVLVDDSRDLAVFGSRHAYESAGVLLANDYGNGTGEPPGGRGSGEPQGAYFETREVDSGSTREVQRRLRITPIPNRKCRITAEILRTPLAVTAALLASGGSSVSLPGEDIESILVPLALKNWSMSPWFKNAEARAEIAVQAAEALRELVELDVSGGSEGVMIMRGI